MDDVVLRDEADLRAAALPVARYRRRPTGRSRRRRRGSRRATRATSTCHLHSDRPGPRVRLVRPRTRRRPEPGGCRGRRRRRRRRAAPRVVGRTLRRGGVSRLISGSHRRIARNIGSRPSGLLPRKKIRQTGQRVTALAADHGSMDWKLELVSVPVSDVDRAKAFYTDQVGFVADVDQRVSDEIRFVQVTPPGSACSIAFGQGITTAEPGSVEGLQIVVADVRGRACRVGRERRRRQRRAGVSVGIVRVLPRSRRQRLGGAATAGA